LTLLEDLPPLIRKDSQHSAHVLAPARYVFGEQYEDIHPPFDMRIMVDQLTDAMAAVPPQILISCQKEEVTSWRNVEKIHHGSEFWMGARTALVLVIAWRNMFRCRNWQITGEVGLLVALEDAMTVSRADLAGRGATFPSIDWPLSVRWFDRSPALTRQWDSALRQGP